MKDESGCLITQSGNSIRWWNQRLNDARWTWLLGLQPFGGYCPVWTQKEIV